MIPSNDELIAALDNLKLKIKGTETKSITLEKISSKYNMAVILFNVQKEKRGQYYFTAELLFDQTAGLPEHYITETHVRRLEEIIREHPEYWIWSHRRWKHKREQKDG